MKTNLSEIGDLIKQLEKNKSLTEIACKLGVREQTLYTWRRGTRTPPKLAREKIYRMVQSMLRKQKEEAKK